jgi:NAD(P)-dependent dehydrogenase (short-subunit alcohol dehydrogenase family)
VTARRSTATAESVPERRFDDRVVIVTGAGRGIGRGHALLFASRGARVVVADIGGEVDGRGSSTGPADSVVAEIVDAGGDAVACCASVADEAGAESIVTTALHTYGRVDVVVNNAGIHHMGPFMTQTPDDFRRMLEVHFFGTLFMIRAAWPHFVDAGYGRIVNTATKSVFSGNQLTSYSVAKGAVYALTRNLATEGAPHGIHVNAIAPRAFTRMSEFAFASYPDDAREKARTALAPELNAPGAVYLAHESCPLNGEVLRTGMGSIGRLAVVHTQGIAGDPLTVEDIADQLDTVLDVTDATIVLPEE